ncbi:hypothetical protein ACFLZF_00625 [Nanoarchaeota archaeon]
MENKYVPNHAKKTIYDSRMDQKESPFTKKINEALKDIPKEIQINTGKAIYSSIIIEIPQKYNEFRL